MHIKIICLIGYSGSGKTYFIMNSIRLLKQLKKDYHVAVIKNIHEHKIDKEEKDTFKYGEAGAIYSITKNVFDETTIFVKTKFKIEQVIGWLEKSPFQIDLIFIEGFRNLEYPTILCLKDWKEFESQFNNNIAMISGLVCNNNANVNDKKGRNLPVIDIQRDFKKFLKIFNLL